MGGRYIYRDVLQLILDSTYLYMWNYLQVVYFVQMPSKNAPRNGPLPHFLCIQARHFLFLGNDRCFTETKEVIHRQGVKPDLISKMVNREDL